MPERLPFFHEIPAHSYTVALDGVQYEVRLVYRLRTESWYLDLMDENGLALLLGIRLSPNSSPNAGLIVTGPPGVLFAFGADPYARNELELWYFNEAELLEAKAAALVDESLPLVSFQ